MFDNWGLGDGMCSSGHSGNGYRYSKNSMLFQERAQNRDEIGYKKEAIDSLDCAALNAGKTGRQCLPPLKDDFTIDFSSANMNSFPLLHQVLSQMSLIDSSSHSNE